MFVNRFKYGFRKAGSAAMVAAMMCVSSPAFAFSVDFTGMPMNEALKALGMRAGRNVVVSGKLQDTVTMHLDDTDFDTAMKAMATLYNISYVYQDDMVIVGQQKSLNSQRNFFVKHLDLDLLKKQLEPLVENNDDVVVNKDLSSVTVVAAEPTLERIGKMIKESDVAQKQVNIQAAVIELSQGKARQMGLAFNEQGWTRQTIINRRASDSDNNGFIFGITAQHEETKNWGKVWARPNVTVFDGRQAKVVMGDQVPVFTSTGSGSDSNANVNVEYKDVGVKLEVVPRINDKEKDVITLKIKPSVSTITQWVESGNNKAPQISTRSVETIVRVKAGDTILIGGLLKEDEIRNIKAIPFLSKIPWLGEFFKQRSVSKSNTELVIAITPTIIRDINGVPRVEFQRLKPSLHGELNKAQDEPMHLNLPSAKQKAYEEELSKLRKSNSELQSVAKSRETENAAKIKEAEALRKERDALVKELNKNNSILEAIAKKLKEGDQ